MTTDKSESTIRDRHLMALRVKDVVFLFAFYFIVLVIGTAISVNCLVNIDGMKINSLTIYSLLCSASLIGSSIFFARKLYKAGINEDYNFEPSGFTLARVSTLAYFIFRVPISASFALVTFSLWRLSLAGTPLPSTVLDGEFKFVLIVIGFFSGFSAGRLLTSFDERGPQFLNKKE